MKLCSICNNKINGEPYVCQPDGVFIHVINSPVCPSCFRAWATGNNEYLIEKTKEKWKK